MDLNKNYTTRIKSSVSNEQVEHKNQPLKRLIEIAKSNKQKILILQDKENEISRFNTHTMKFERERLNNHKLNKKRKISYKKIKKAS